MSLIIDHQPNLLSSAGEPIYYKIRTTDPQIVKMGIVLINMNGSNGTPVVDWTQEPELGTTDTYVFQLDEVIEDLLAYDQPELSYGMLHDRPKSVVKYGIIVFEYNSPSSIKQYTGLADNPLYAISTTANELLPQTLSEYLIENNNKCFLTNSPHYKDVGLFDHEYLDHIWLSPRPNDLVFRAFQKDGTQKLISYSLQTSDADKLTSRASVGPKDLNLYNLGFIDEQTKHYTIALKYSAGGNLFTDGDNGTFNANLNNISSVSGVGLTHNSSLAWHGSNVLSFPMSMGVIGSFIDVWQGDTLLTLQAGETYEITATITHNVGGSMGELGGLRLGVSGFTDATLNYTVFPVQGMADPGEHFFPVTTMVTVGNDTQGRLVMQQEGSLRGVFISCDDVSVRKMDISEPIKTYVLDHQCHTDATRIHFLNSLGGFDSFTFIGTERQKLAVVGEHYDKGRTLNRKYSDRGATVLQKQASRTLNCSSGPLTPEDMCWLEELLVSPAVYVERDNKLLPVILKNGEFEVMDKQNNIHKLSVQLQLANTTRSQRN